MFSSLATFLFGAQPTSESTNPSQANPVQTNANDSGNDQPVGDVIEVTSTTPSVAGNNRGTVRLSNGKRGGAKNRRGRQRYQQQLQQQQQQQQQGGQRKQPPTLTKLLTPNGECVIEDDFNEDEWYIVEKEDEEDDSLPRSDSEEELSVSKAAPSGSGAAVTAAATTRRRQHINSHSLYSGPRPQQQRNHLQRTRAARTLSISTLSPPRTVPDDSDNAVSQSLYAPVVVAAAAISPSGSESSGGKGLGSGVLMEESWYVTPPPCFTSIGPINMEASPFENLLIEHPSMSVYHSIRSSQAGTESFVNLDLGSAEPEPEPAPVSAVVQQQQQAQQAPRNHNAYFDRHAAEKLKQQTLARQSQKSHNKKQRQQLCRSAMKRANKVRDIQAKGQRSRRSDMQHCKLLSGANNNRKCC
ncbi:alpha-protein kinase 1 isoform X1 [Drosophila montana]|uniref:alpha-protein kinase 1 isoform X1 n=1 Tax=Drosophila montana TaxID=40370 RepID=UPI00313B253A